MQSLENNELQSAKAQPEMDNLRNNIPLYVFSPLVINEGDFAFYGPSSFWLLYSSDRREGILMHVHPDTSL